MASPEPLMAHRKRPVQPERDRNDFAGTLTVDLMRAPSPGGPTPYYQTLPHDPIAAQKRNEARRTPQHGPKGLHTIAVGKRPLPNTHDVCVCVCVCERERECLSLSHTRRYKHTHTNANTQTNTYTYFPFVSASLSLSYSHTLSLSFSRSCDSHNVYIDTYTDYSFDHVRPEHRAGA